MSSISPQEKEELKKQLKEKTEEIKAIYDKLILAGAVPLPDDFLDSVSGGISSMPVIMSNSGTKPR